MRQMEVMMTETFRNKLLSKNSIVQTEKTSAKIQVICHRSNHKEDNFMIGNKEDELHIT